MFYCYFLIILLLLLNRKKYNQIEIITKQTVKHEKRNFTLVSDGDFHELS